MRKLALMSLLVLWLAAPVRAQEGDRLHAPAPQDFIDHLAAIFQPMAALDQGTSSNAYAPSQLVAFALTDEVDWRFLQAGSLTYQQLDALYRAYLVGEGYYAFPEEPWLPAILQRWLAENAIDLSQTARLDFDGYHVAVKSLYIPYEDSSYFQSDRWGYFLRVEDEPGGRRSGYIVLPGEEGYLFPALPEALHGDLLDYGDFDADGRFDIAYLHSSHIGNSYNAGQLVIASLNADQAFTSTATLRYFQGGYEFPPSWYHWWFARTGPQATVIQSQQLMSNWECTFVRVTLYGWNADGRLEMQSSRDMLPATSGCTILQAEQAMWAQDYARAIRFYRQAFETDSPSDALRPYATLRLGLAYLLTDQPDEAAAIFASLADSESDFVRTALAVYTHDPRALPVCQAMYQYPFQGAGRLPSTGVLETYDGGFSRFDVGITYFNLENATCDLAPLLDVHLATMTFPLDAAPLAQIEALGVDIAEAMQTDLDRDGQAEWLIWLDAPGIDPLFFAPAGDSYRLTRPRGTNELYWRPGADLRQPTANNHYALMTLPGGEQVIVDVDLDQDAHAALNSMNMGEAAYARCSGDASSIPHDAGDVTLWRLQDGTLVNLFIAPLCDAVDLDGLFATADRRQLLAGDYVFPDAMSPDSIVVPATYIWDAQAGTYLPAPQPTETPFNTPTPIPTDAPPPTPRYALTDSSLNWLRAAFQAGDYAAALAIADAALASEPPLNPDRLGPPFRYYRALALEALGQRAAALAAYEALAAETPDSAWGLLAALHFDPAE